MTVSGYKIAIKPSAMLEYPPTPIPDKILKIIDKNKKTYLFSIQYKHQNPARLNDNIIIEIVINLDFSIIFNKNSYQIINKYK